MKIGRIGDKSKYRRDDGNGQRTGGVAHRAWIITLETGTTPSMPHHIPVVEYFLVVP